MTDQPSDVIGVDAPLTISIPSAYWPGLLVCHGDNSVTRLDDTGGLHGVRHRRAADRLGDPHMTRAVSIPAPDHDARHPFDCRTHLGGTGWARRALGIGGLSACPVCGRWWYLDRTPHGPQPGFTWRPVRWYHYRLRRRITESGSGSRT